MGGYREKCGQHRSCGFKFRPSPLITGSRDLESSPSGDGTEADNLTNRDFPHTCKCLLQKDDFSSVFRASPVSALS